MKTLRLSASLIGLMSGILICDLATGQSQSTARPSIDPSARLSDFQAVEFRRYSIKEGERQHFAEYFESFFPEAMEQTGAIAAGSFFERGNQNGFTWIRGFHTIEDRAVENAEFYYGPVWREHRVTLNNLITDSDNVWLLHPLASERGLTILPAVDPVMEPDGAHGVAVALYLRSMQTAWKRLANKPSPRSPVTERRAHERLACWLH
jgi:hypothetical protein